MDTIDRPDSNVPARYSGESLRVPAPIAAMSRDLAIASPAGPQITPRVLMRGLGRHWWRIMLFWVIVSTPLAYLIYALVEPSFEATSLLVAEPTTIDLYGGTSRGTPNLSEVKPYLLTQVNLITSNSVLDAALADPAIRNLSLIRSFKDPKAELRQEMRVEIIGENTYLIRVALAAKEPYQAAAIVNAVVEAYIEQHNRYHLTKNRSLKLNLETELKKLDQKVKDAQEELTKVVERGNVVAPADLTPRTGGTEEDEASRSSFGKVPEVRYQQATAELFATDMRVIDAQAALETAKAQLAKVKEMAAAAEEERSQLEAEDFEARMHEEFKKDPDVQPLIAQIVEAREELKRNRTKARRADEPSVMAAQRQIDNLMGQWNALWEEKKDEIGDRLKFGGDDMRPEAWAAKVADLEATVETLKKKRVNLAKMIEGLKPESTAKNLDQLKAANLNEELRYNRRLQEAVKQRLSQLEFDIGQESYRVEVQDKAQVPQMASNNKRIKYMAAAPVGVLFLMLGLFMLLEVKAERVGDPDALSTRVQSEVYALPPLPTARSLRKRSVPDTDDQIEQFIQRLDHLRFAVCGNPAELEKGRCVLITSAVGGEGKTTLAAQLAARCGNAGMSTLLIDADLRRTGLCSLLDVPEGPGLSDALISDEPAPTELVVPVQGGTFHLLPAGRRCRTPAACSRIASSG